ncbi:MAG: Dna2/Cas4 domain-containing protein [Anaerolineales bacterium]|nr:Dna2/Cas4 domain-containing protein [Anaerolineales bacterium]MCW5888833.1 Dna2/Cas4 domain-containing protein [Anaerolineales bacterium]
MYAAWAALLFLLAVLLWGWSQRQRAGLGLPAGAVVYSDTGVERRVEQALFDEALGLVGRPDYLVESAAGLVPVEVKSGRTPARPYPSHVYQLAAYCLLVARSLQRRPPYGILRYPQRSFQVEFTAALEAEVLELLSAMRQSMRQIEVHRSHKQAARCQACGYRQDCTERIH